MQRRIISSYDNDPVEDNEENDEKMELDQAPPAPSFRTKDKKKRVDSGDKPKKSSLLSFDDEGNFQESHFNRNNSNRFILILVKSPDEGETFQVKKSSHSKKVMKMMDRERRKKKSSGHSPTRQPSSEYSPGGHRHLPSPPPPPSFYSTSTTSSAVDQNSVKRILPPDNSNSIQTEIRTDDFVVRLLLSIFLHCSRTLDTHIEI